MDRQEIEQRIGELTRDYLRGKRGCCPRSVEVRIEGDRLAVRMRGFLEWTEHAAMESPTDRPSVEEHYLRLFEQIAPLLRAGVREATGRTVLEVRILLKLPEDECLLLSTLGRENTEGLAVVSVLGERCCRHRIVRPGP